jgi:hypothetical protein
VFVPYTAAGPWDGGEHCAPALSPGARALGDALYASHGPDLRLGGFGCEPSASDPSLMSMQGTGRSLDLTPTDDPALGDAIANYLVEHAGELGVQLVAWNGTRWNGSYTGEKDAPILGGSTYRDHVHAELTPEAAGPVDTADGGVGLGGAGVGVDAGPTDAGPLAACAGFRAVGYEVCVEETGRCEIIFRDGAGCTVACARVAMRCADSWNDLDGVCAPSPSEHAGCGSTGHTSDYCACVAR